MDAGDRQAERAQIVIDIRDLAAGDDGDRAIHRHRQIGQRRPRLRLEPHRIRALGDLDKRAIEIEKQGMSPAIDREGQDRALGHRLERDCNLARVHHWAENATGRSNVPAQFRRSQRLDEGDEALAARLVQPEKGIARPSCLAVMPQYCVADAGRPAVMQIAPLRRPHRCSIRQAVRCAIPLALAVPSAVPSLSPGPIWCRRRSE